MRDGLCPQKQRARVRVPHIAMVLGARFDGRFDAPAESQVSPRLGAAAGSGRAPHMTPPRTMRSGVAVGDGSGEAWSLF